MQSYFKIFEEKHGLPHTLFHGLNGSRALELDQWHDANVHNVHDGSGVTEYLSGFHVLETPYDVLIALKPFRNLSNRVVCRVWVDETAGVWPKSHSLSNAILAHRMKITRPSWARRLPAAKFAERVRTFEDRVLQGWMRDHEDDHDLGNKRVG
jgi:hypothetical protein